MEAAVEIGSTPIAHRLVLTYTAYDIIPVDQARFIAESNYYFASNLLIACLAT